MVRPGWALMGALVLLGGWLGVIAYETQGEAGLALVALAESARRCRLPGLAAEGYLAAAQWRVGELERGGEARASARGQELLAEIVAYRCAAAWTLLEAGYTAAAEAVALRAAQAQYDDPAARAVLLAARSRGTAAPEAARLELLRLVAREETPATLYALGRTLWWEAKPEEAEGFWERALELDPCFAPGYLALAEAALARGDLATARSRLEAARTLCRDEATRQVWGDLQLRLDPGPVAILQRWLAVHGVSLLLALGYTLFLFSPMLCRRFRCASRLNISSTFLGFCLTVMG